MRGENLEEKIFVSLVNNIASLYENVNVDNLDSKLINGKHTYKLENEPGIIWTANATKDEFYSEFERVQPAERMYAAFYRIKPTTYVIKPRDIMPIAIDVQKYMQTGNFEEVKKQIVAYIRQKTKNNSIENVICRVDDKNDIENLHQFFNTTSVQDAVKGYSKAFSATFWNNINEKDDSFFQVPTLMITDKSAMTNPTIIQTVSYLRRKNGANKYTGNNAMKIEMNKLDNLLQSKLNVENAVTLLKVREIFENDGNITKKIDEKLNGSLLLKQAMHIKEQDKNAIQISIIMKQKEKSRIKKEILKNKQLLKELRKSRLEQSRMDEYMAVYVEMIEKNESEKLLKPVERKRTLIEKIQDFFNRSKLKALPEPAKQREADNKKSINASDAEYTKTGEEARRQAFIEKIHANYQEKQPVQYSIKTVEGAIQQFLNAYVYESAKGDSSVYSILTGLGGRVEQERFNPIAENLFLNNLKKNKQFNIKNQHNAFYHIYNKEWQQAGLDIDTRLYLNPTRENLIPMVEEILKRNGNNPIYLKLETEAQMQQKAMKNEGRSEKIVIYANGGKDGNLGRIGQILTQIKNEKPEIFKGCEYMNPFMKNIDGIASYAPSPNTSNFIRLDGQTVNVSKSYNSFLAEALEESMNQALNDIAMSRKINGFDQLSRTQQVQKLLETSPDKIILPMKRYLAQCQRNNPILDIKGIEKEQNKDKER